MSLQCVKVHFVQFVNTSMLLLTFFWIVLSVFSLFHRKRDQSKLSELPRSLCVNNSLICMNSSCLFTSHLARRQTQKPLFFLLIFYFKPLISTFQHFIHFIISFSEPHYTGNISATPSRFTLIIKDSLLCEEK